MSATDGTLLPHAWAESFAETFGEIVVVFDADFRVLWMNAGGGEFLGIDPEAVVGQAPPIPITDDRIDDVAEAFATFVGTPGGALDAEMKIQRADGAWRDIQMVGSNKLNQPDVQSIIVVGHDVTVLRDAERRSMELFEHAPDPVIVIDLDNGLMIAANAAIEELTGWSREEIPHQELLSYAAETQPDGRTSADVLHEALEALRRDGRGTLEWTIVDRAGTQHICALRAALLPDQQRALVAIQDITKLHDAAEALAANEAWFRAIIEHTTDVICVLSDEGDIRWFSPSASKVLGHREDSNNAVHPDDIEITTAAFMDCLSGKSSSVRHRLQHADGSWVWFDSRYYDLRDVAGVGDLMITSRPIGDEIRAEAALAQNEAKLQALYDNASDVIIILYPNGEWEASAAGTRQLGYPKGEDIEGGLFGLIHPDDAERASIALAEVLDGTRTAQEPVELRMRAADGTWWDYECVGENLGGIEAIGGVVITARNITERKRNERARAAAENELRAVVDASPDPIAVIGSDGLIRSLHGVIDDIDPADVIGQPLDVLCGPNLNTGADAAIARARAGHTAQFSFSRHTGVTRHYQVHVAAVDEARCVLVIRNISDELELRDRLEASEQRFKALIRRSSDVVIIVGEQDTIDYVSPAVGGVLGLKPATLLGSALRVIGDISSEERLTDALTAARTEGTATVEVGIGHGDQRVAEVRLVDCRNDPAISGVLVHIRDITDWRAAEAALAHSALHDTLTGLPNRAYLQRRLEDVLLRVKQQKVSAAVLYIDLDNFKNVNDSLGHTTGDELLCQVAERLSGSVRASDMIARLGGDEFVVLTEDLANADPSVFGGRVATRLLAAFAEPVQLGDYAIRVTPSVGVRPIYEDDTQADVLRDADTALYAAKDAGRNRYEVFQTAMHDAAKRRVRLEGALVGALERGELSYVYQPIVDAQTKKPSSVEMLVRWHNPELGDVPVSEFLPVAEESGLIDSIGLWLLRQAVADAKILFSTHKICVHVNLSARQLLRADLADWLLASCNDLPAGALCLELTESVYLTAQDSGRDQLGALRAGGILIAIDDFGAGYSSFERLAGLEADILKLDGSFVAGVAGNVRHQAICAAAIKLAHDLDMQAIAERVEQPEQFEALIELGVDAVQGFLYGKPVQPIQLGDVLEELGVLWATALNLETVEVVIGDEPDEDHEVEVGRRASD